MSGTPWQCPYCHGHATIRDSDSYDEILRFEHDSVGRKYEGYNTYALRTEFIVCPNPKCEELSLRAVLAMVLLKHNDYGGQYWDQWKKILRWQLLPESLAKPFPSYVPEAVLKDYQEACLIKTKSPNASATLARRCLQTMIRERFNVEGKPSLKNEIDSIKSKVAPNVWTAIQAVRKVGAIGAHMEEDVNLIINVDEGEADELVRLIEFLIERWYVQRYEEEKQLEDIKEMVSKKEKEIAAKKEGRKKGKKDSSTS